MRKELISDATSSGTVTATPAHVTSRYTLVERPQGFRVEGGKDRIPVEVHLNGTHWTVREASEDGLETYSYTIGLYSFRSLLRTIASRLMGMWQSDEGGSMWAGLYEWAIAQTSHSICARVHAQWQRLLDTVPRDVQQVAKRVFAVTFGSYQLGCETWDELFTGDYAQLVQDIGTYPAAAIACHCAIGLGTNVAQSMRIQREYWKQATSPGSVEALFDAVCSPVWIDPFVEETQAAKVSQGRRAVLDLLASDWKAFFSCTGSAYRSINRTLMALPGSIPYGLLCSFPYARLERPITDRVELLALLFFCEQLGMSRYENDTGGYEERPVAEHWAYSLFSKATRPAITRAMGRYDAHMHRKSGPPTASRIYELVRFICLHCAQLPSSPKHNIVGLTELAIERHNQQFQQMLADALKSTDVTAPLAAPSVAPPTNPAIRMLTTAAEVVQEGWHMGHCIPLYIDDAVHGRAYLFHITFRGEEASALVSQQGIVVMCQGAHSRVNGASVYGTRMLSHWGKGLSQTTGEPESSAEPATVHEETSNQVVV